MLPQWLTIADMFVLVSSVGLIDHYSLINAELS